MDEIKEVNERGKEQIVANVNSEQIFEESEEDDDGKENISRYGVSEEKQIVAVPN